MTKKYFYEQIEKIAILAHNGFLTLGDTETELNKIVESARFPLNTHDFVALKRKTWRVLLDLTKGI